MKVMLRLWFLSLCFARKETYHKWQSDQQSIDYSGHGVTSGRTSVAKLKKEKVPKIESVDPWDGNDAPALEEEFDLSDIMGSSDDDEEKEAEAKEEL